MPQEACYDPSRPNINYDKLMDADSGLFSDGDGKYIAGIRCQWIIQPKASAAEEHNAARRASVARLPFENYTSARSVGTARVSASSAHAQVPADEIILNFDSLSLEEGYDFLRVSHVNSSKRCSAVPVRAAAVQCTSMPLPRSCRFTKALPLLASWCTS